MDNKKAPFKRALFCLFAIQMMIMRLLLCLIVTLIGLSSCQNKPAGQINGKTFDTLAYKYTSVKKTTGACRKPDDICAIVEFSYPVFDAGRGDSLNKWVGEKMGEGYMDTLIHDNYAEVMQQFLVSYEEVIKSMPDYITPWEYKRSAKVEKQAADFITFHILIYEFAGGAHPNYTDTYFHYDLKNNREFTIDDQLVTGGDAKLAAIAEGIFRKEFKLSDNISLDSAGFFFDNGQFFLPSNYTFAQSGIKFHYNDYEIRSHAEGPYDLTVPYTEIKGLAKPSSYLATMIPPVQ